MDDYRPDPAPASPAIIRADQVRMTRDAIVVGSHSHAGGHGEPKIQIVREDGVIRAIDITCRCGEKIRVRCDYT